MRASSCVSPGRVSRCLRFSRLRKSSLFRCCAARWCSDARDAGSGFAVAEPRSLIRRRHEPGAPDAAAAGRLFVVVQQHHKRGQVLVLGSQTVGHPRSQAGPPGKDAAGVHLADAADVVQPVRPARTDHGDSSTIRRRADTSWRPASRSRRIASTSAGWPAADSPKRPSA